MNSIIKVFPLERSRTIGVSLAFCGMLTLAGVTALADGGRGSIRAAARPAPENARRAEPARAQPEARREQPAARQPEARQREARQPEARQPEGRQSEAHREVRPEPAHVEVPARRDWDANDEDARHFGGFARGGAEHVFRGARVHDLPSRHFDVHFHDRDYFLDDSGAYYLAQPDGQYEVVQPPVGVVVGALPDDTIPIGYGPTTYYYLDGVFYVPDGNGFAVVNPPPGIVVPAIPSGANQVVVNGNVVYQLDGFNYTPSIQDGVTAYTVTPA